MQFSISAIIILKLNSQPREFESMPNYQYRCLNCKRRFEVYLTYSQYGQKPVSCPNCGSEHVERRIGRVRFARSEESRLEDFSDPSSLAGLEDDPRALARMMRKMSHEMDEDLGPEFTDVVDRLESGQSPEEIEKAMPDLAEGGGDLGGGDDF
jgi:putative FmdB family regulatory protein